MVLAGVLAWPAAAAADTMVDAGFVRDQVVWTAAGSPYVVAGTLDVVLGAELRIEAGTEVRFNTGALQIDGTLTIAGTAAAPVVVHPPNSGTGVVGWTGIQPFERSVVRINHAIIRNAMVGLRVSTTQVDVQIDRTTFEDCNIGLSIWRGGFAFDSIVARNNRMGIEVYAVSPPTAALTLTNAVVQGTDGIGIVAKNGALVTIINSTIDGNKTGMVGYISPAPTIVLRNTILSNNPRAIYVDESNSSGPPMVTATQTTFWRNGSNLVHEFGTNPP
ncbi:MAG TPA: right-handed parallel beta-helix repeat-containing protein, partial [Polyangia bacterium]